jgi:CubicO group peptidase (beta-lactamase class C family)
MKKNSSLLICILVLLLLGTWSCQREKGLDTNKLSRVDSLIYDALEEGLFPGGVLAVVYNDKLEYLKGYGNKAVYPKEEPISLNTIFDLASVTKPFTALSVMLLVEQGKIRLEDRIKTFFPEFPSNITIKHLLTHTSGIADYSNIGAELDTYGRGNREGLKKYILSRTGQSKPGEKFEYSCLNFVLLQYIVEDITKTTLSTFEYENIFKPLGMTSTGYNPTGDLLERTAPTEKVADGVVLKGMVHDSLALFFNEGVSGNAGLFSTAEDLVIFAKMLMNNGSLHHATILSPRTLQTMITVPEDLQPFGRSLGWDNYSPYASDHGNLLSRKETFGHTGYTGTSFFVDPVNKLAVMFLAHRVHPYNVGNMVPFRSKLANIVAGALP